jgi:GNAT superfamily N-acetyltransferase
MVTSPAAALTIRDALAREAPMLTQVLGAPFAASPVGQWLDPDPKTRRMSAAGHIGGLVAATITSGIAQVAEDDDGEIVGVALWARYPREVQSSTSTGSAVSLLDPAILTIRRRQTVLAQVTDSSRPPAVESYCLAYLGVRPDRQCQGIGSRLLVTHHALLHLRKMPAFLLADDRSRKLFERHRYTCIGLPQMLPGGPLVWAMRRPPVPADPL